MNTFTREQLLAALDRINEKDAAKLQQSNLSPTTEFYSRVIDLSVAQSKGDPFVLEFPTKGILIRDASDSNASINFLFDNRSGLNGDGTVLRKNSVWNSDYPIARCLFWWAAQAGKTLTVEFFRRSIVLPGNFATSISQVYSSIEDGTALKSVTTVATVLLALDYDRKNATISNLGATRIYIGNANVTGIAGAKCGIPLEPGMSYELQNTAAVYGITDSGTNASIVVNVNK